MSFELILPKKIVFGAGSIDGIGGEASRLGASSVLVITSPGMPNRESLKRIAASLQREGLAVEVHPNVTPEPVIELVRDCVSAAKRGRSGLLIGLGGGSVMDVAKKAAAELSLPKLMVPTTAGTGSEVTHESILKVDGKKKAFVDIGLTPDVAIVDPDLGATMSRALIAGSGMDALAHAVECYEARRTNPLSRTLALEAYKMIKDNLRQAVDGDRAAMGNMFLGSLTAGIAFGNAGTALGHGLSYPLSNRGIPHGEAVAMVLPYALEYNGAEAALVEQTRELAAIAAPQWDRSWDIDEMVREVMLDERHLSNNPREVTEEDVGRLFRKMEQQS